MPKAYIRENSTTLSLQQIKDALAGKLEPYKIPAFFEWIAEIPKTSSGKKQRLSLKQ